jgi:hypothetical protein
MHYNVVVQGQPIEIDYWSVHLGAELIEAAKKVAKVDHYPGEWELRDGRGHYMWPDKPIAQYANELLYLNLKAGTGA